MVVKRISNDELYHHGVKGQRWGFRRYQNKDGTLTDAGRKRYLSDIDKSKIDFTEYDSAYEKYKKISDAVVDKHDSAQADRIKEASDTALRAMDRNDDYGIGYKKYYRDEDEDMKRSARSWLTWEDQTIGYLEVADLANQGKSAREISDIVEQAEKAYDEIYSKGYDVVNQVKNNELSELDMTDIFDYETDDYISEKVLTAVGNSEAVFDLADFANNIDKSFIDACVKEAAIKNRKKSRRN